jgi:hypothetical protein
MSAQMVMLPVVDVPALRRLTQELTGPKKGELAEARRRLGVTMERVFLLATPMGHVLLVHAEGDNIVQFGPRLMASNNPTDKWFMAQANPIHGFTAGQMPFVAPPQLGFEWGRHTAGATDAAALAAPIQAGKVEDWWKFCGELSIRGGEHAESRRAAGVTLERAFVAQTPQGAFALVYMEGTGKAADRMARFAASTSDYDKWFADRAKAIHGIDLRGSTPPPAAELLFSGDY